MNLFRETGSAFAWVAQVLWAFCRVRLWTTFALICSITISRFAGLLAFFLPLKVILLAGSDGVPRYFRFFIDPDQRMEWIIGLSAAAVGFYVLSLIAESVSKKLSEMGSLDVLQGANELAVASRQREEARSYYRRFSGIAANLTLAAMAFLLLGWLQPGLTLVLLILILGQYLFTTAAVYYGNALEPGPLLRMIRGNLGGYLKIFVSMNFLAGFFALLVPFVLGTGGNLLLAILAILLLRQALGALSRMATVTTELWKSRKVIDPLVFRERQIEKVERPVVRNLREVFAKPAREASAMQALKAGGVELARLESDWEDSSIGNVYTFHLKAQQSSSTEKRSYQQQVFSRSRLHLLEHEAYLFEYVDRSALSAPEMLVRFAEGPFECQIVDYGVGSACPAGEWKALVGDLFTRMWAFEPPAELLHAFSTSRPTLERRLSIDYLQRLELALDSPELVDDYETFLDRLPRIRDVLSRVPLYIHNPDLGRVRVALDHSGQPLVMTWGRWSIEPIGVALPDGLDEAVIDKILEKVAGARDLKPGELTSEHLMLAFEFRALERDIAASKYCSALKRIQTILGSHCLEAARSPAAEGVA